MVRNEGVPVSSEEKQEKGEKFLGDLYDRICQWAEKEDLAKVQEFGEAEIRRWESWDEGPGGITTLSLELQKAVIFMKENLTFALVLGNGRRSNNDWRESTRLQFGGFYSSPKEDKQFDLDDLKLMVCQSPLRGNYLYGEFYYAGLPIGLKIDCLADKSRFRGEEIGRPQIMGGWTQERILSEEGLAACLKIVKRTVKQGE